MPVERPKFIHNPGGSNRYTQKPLLESYPELPKLIQQYFNENVRQIDIPEILERKHGIKLCVRTVKRISKKFSLRTVRRSGLSDVEKGTAILAVIEDDPMNQWGARLLKEKLLVRGYHLSREFINTFQKTRDPVAVAARHPVTRKVHTHTLWSAGPNEEWCVDGHEKLLQTMGIGIWGIVDKYSRDELKLVAAPNIRSPDVPITVYLQAARAVGGIPTVLTADKGGELGPLFAMQGALRQIYLPDLDPAILPPVKATKSIYNITRERAWRPLLEKELRNVQAEYLDAGHQFDVGFHPNDPVHGAIALWLWGQIVQERLDDYLKTHHMHYVRFQQNVQLPTGGRHIDFYENPGKWKAMDCLVTVPGDHIDRLAAEYGNPAALQFGSDATVTICKKIFQAIGGPELHARTGWTIFKNMVALLDETAVLTILENQ